MSKKKPIAKTQDEINELEKFYLSKQSEQKALIKLLAELKKKTKTDESNLNENKHEKE